MVTQPLDEMHPEDNPLVRWFMKRSRAIQELRGNDFFVRGDGIEWSRRVEVWYHADGNEIIRFRSFLCTGPLEPYLEEIALPEIF